MLLDVFRNSAFSLTALTQAILKLPYKPSRLGELGIFQEKGVPTLTVVIEEKNGLLALLSTAERGSQAAAARRQMRKARSFLVPHIPYDDAVLAADVQGVRAFGSENEVMTVAGLVNDRLQEMRQAHEVTLEWHRMGALHGKILDADASTTIYNLFDEFALSGTGETSGTYSAGAPSGFVYGYSGTSGPDSGSSSYNPEFGIGQGFLDIGGITGVSSSVTLSSGQHGYCFVLSDPTYNVRATCVAIARDMEKTLGMSTYDHIHAFCGANFFDKLIDHDDVRATYLNWFQAQSLRQDIRKGFEYGGITWENYRGTVSGHVFQDPDSAIIFPVGVPNLFVTYYAPADFVETVNTIGLPLYAKQEPLPFGRGIQIHTQSNPLALCTRPLVLIKGWLA